MHANFCVKILKIKEHELNKCNISVDKGLNSVFRIIIKVTAIIINALFFTLWNYESGHKMHVNTSAFKEFKIYECTLSKCNNSELKKKKNNSLFQQCRINTPFSCTAHFTWGPDGCVITRNGNWPVAFNFHSWHSLIVDFNFLYFRSLTPPVETRIWC